MDPGQPESFRNHATWRELDETLSVFQIDPDSEEVKSFSFSGDERNRLFLNKNGTFVDQTLVSGVDYREDGRGFVVSDFDRDGLLDMGIVSTQSPRFRIAKLSNLPSRPNSHNYVEIRLVGKNGTREPRENESPRDPVGATLRAKTASNTRMFQLSGGEGFSVQNSRAIHIGLGGLSKIDELEVRWPSGNITVKKNIPANTRLVIEETAN